MARPDDQEFDYNLEKMQVRALFEEWRSDEERAQAAMAALRQREHLRREGAGSDSVR